MHIHKLVVIAVFAALTVTAKAQNTVIPIETKSNAIVLQVTNDGYVNMIYFGKKLVDKNEYQQTQHFYHLDGNGVFNSAYTGTTRNLLEPAFAVTHADGN